MNVYWESRKHQCWMIWSLVLGEGYNKPNRAFDSTGCPSLLW